MNVGFFVRHFTERGTEIAIYDYADNNEKILNNKSYIICFTEKTQQNYGLPTERHSYDKFKSRFSIIEINEMGDMASIIEEYNLTEEPIENELEEIIKLTKTIAIAYKNYCVNTNKICNIKYLSLPLVLSNIYKDI
jgi:hypothetical protein